MRLHGGEISITEAPGGGALFQVVLPSKAPNGWPVRTASETGPLPPEEGSVLTGTLEELRPVPDLVDADLPALTRPLPLVLVVEDNPEMSRFIADSLRGEFNVITAFDGPEGLRKAREAAPDLVISDIMMPVLSGDKMVAQLRSDRALERMPILVLSAKADDELRLLGNGAQDYLVHAESKERRSRLNESEAKFHTITNAMPQMVWTTLPDGYPVYSDAGHVAGGIRLHRRRGAQIERRPRTGARGSARCVHPRHWLARDTAACVLIAVTGYGQARDREAAIEAGFDHHLVKPVDGERLFNILGDIETVSRKLVLK